MEGITREQMIAIGGKPWQPKQGPERIYLNEWHEMAGLEIERYHTGNIKSAYLDGEKISNIKAYNLANGKVYFTEDMLCLEVKPELRPKLLESIAAKIAALATPES